MMLRKVLPLSFLFVSLAALPALAGSSYVENSFNLRNIYNGKSKTDVNINEIYHGIRSAGSDAIKNTHSVTTTSYKEKGDIRLDNGDTVWRNTKFYETDVSDIVTTSWSRESGSFSKLTNINVRDTYNFSGFDKVHRATSGFDF